MSRTLYTKPELKIIKEIINRANKKENIYLFKRENEIYVCFNGICEIKVCTVCDFPYNMESGIFTTPQWDPLEKILKEKISDEIDVYFSSPDKNGMCQILPNAAGVEKIGIDGKKAAFLGKDCKFKLFATETCLYYSVYNEFNEFIGIFCIAKTEYGADLKPEIEKMIKYSEAAKTA